MNTTLPLMTSLLNIFRFAGRKTMPKATAKRILLFGVTVIFSAAGAFGQAPAISYSSSPQVYTVGTAITPLTPTSSGVASQGYNAVPVTLTTSSAYLTGIAADAAGNLFLCSSKNTVYKMPAGSSNLVTVKTITSNPMYSIAVDAADNAYVYYNIGHAIEKIPAGGGTLVGIPYYGAVVRGIAIDPATGYIYVGNSSSGEVDKVSATGAFSRIGIELGTIAGLAEDAAGNVYVSLTSTNTVVEIPVGGGNPFTIGSGFNYPAGLAVDAAGNVYVADGANLAVKEIPAGGGAPVTIGSGFTGPIGLTLDAAGNIDLIDGVSDGVEKIKKITPVGGYYASPVLPAGLTLNSNTGVISGTPTAASAPANYTITGYNSAGVSTTAVVNIGVAATPPTTAANALTFTGTTATTTTASWTKGNGASRAVFMAAAASGSPAPVNLTAYNANAAFGTGDQIGASGWYCVYNGTGSTINITGLSAGTTYQAMVVEYNGTGNTANYLTTSGAGNPASVTTPTTVASITPATSSPTNATTVDYTVTFAAALTTPPSTGDFSLANSSGVTGTINSVTAVGTAGTTYDVNVTNVSGTGTLELDMTGGSDCSPAISNVPFTSGQTYTINQTPPTITVNSFMSNDAGLGYGEAIPGDQVTLSFATSEAVPNYSVSIANSNNTNVINPSGDNVNFIATYTVQSTDSPDGSGYIPYSISVTDAANNSSTYAETTPGAPEIALRLVPTIQASGLNFTNVTAGAATLSWTPGNGASELVFVSQGVGSVTPLLNNNADYTPNPAFGSGSQDNIGNWYCVYNGATSPSGSVGITGLSSGTTYTVMVIDYNGSSGSEQYLNATTTGNPATVTTVTPPTTVSSITPAATSITNASTVDYTVTFAAALTTPPSTGDFSLANSSGVTGTINSVTTTDNINFDVNVTNVSGNGTLELDMTGSSDVMPAITNAPFISGAAGSYTIDQTPPVVTISAPSPSVGNSSANIVYTVTVTDANMNTASLANMSPLNVYLYSHVDGTAMVNSLTVNPNWTQSGNSYSTTVSFDDMTGDGNLSFTIPAGTFTDLAGNAPAADVTSASAIIDNTPPTATISAPSVSSIGTGSTSTVTYTITYADANFSSSDLTNAGITLNTTGTASGTVNVTGAGTSYTVTISNITGLGTLGITLASGYASDLAGNTDAAVAPSATFNVLSSDATLSGITLSAGTLSPGFTSGNTGYTVSLPNSVNTITITPTTNFGSATVTVNGTSASTPVSLTVGQTQIPVVVTAQDGVTTETYTVTVTRAPNTNLGSMYLSKGTLSPAFATGTTSYTASVPYSVSSLTATATEQNALAAITVNGTTVKSGTASGAIPLSVGPNTITTVITGQDGTTKTTYTIVVTRAASTNDNLSALTTSTGSITPAFAQATTAYNLSVANVTASISVTPTTADPTATIKVNGNTITSGSASGPVSLNVGSNTINVAVLAQDGSTTKTYTITVTRAAASNDNLSALTASAAFSPAFAVATTGYTASVANSVTTFTVTPTTSDPNATVQVNGTTVASGATSGAINLSVGSNAINVVVTAANGVTQKTYTITVTRAPSTNDNLSALSTSTGTITPVFAQATTAYGFSVANVTSSITATATTADPTATVSVNGTAVTSGNPSGNINLNVGSNTISVAVLAQDGSTTKTYTITVTRAAASNDNLNNLAISSGTLSPAFAVATTGYTASVANTVTSITVTPTTGDPNATVTVNGSAAVSGSAFGPVSLAIGSNTINVLVTAANGVTQKTYTIVVTRPSSSNDNLSALSTSTGTITPNFAQATTSYNLTVANVTSSITVTPTTADPTATVKVNGTAVSSGSASGSISLNVGANTISIAVLAQDGSTTKTYTITVTRTAASNDNLGNLHISSGTLSPAFAVGTTGYTANVANAIASITVTPTTGDPNATVTVNGTAVTSGTPSAAITLAVGSNTINVLVTAANGVTNKTYSVVVTRATGSADAVDPISVTQPTETPQLADDGIIVHKGVSPNGDGIDDFLQIDNITQYPDNHLVIMNRNGQLVYETKGYDNSTKVFDGHSNKTGQMQLPGTYFFALDYTVGGIIKHKTGFLVLKY